MAANLDDSNNTEVIAIGWKITYWKKIQVIIAIHNVGADLFSWHSSQTSSECIKFFAL